LSIICVAAWIVKASRKPILTAGIAAPLAQKMGDLVFIS
jgi:hypothetical protein